MGVRAGVCSPEREKDPVGPAPGSVTGRPLAAADCAMWALGGHWFCSLWGRVAVLLLLLGVPLRGLALPPIRYSHAGICPNDMNPNLWVDAQSTCKRECETDQVSVSVRDCGSVGGDRSGVPCRAQEPGVMQAPGR